MPSFKSYSERSKAKRALVQVYKVTADPELYLGKVDGKFGFWLDDGVAIPMPVPAEDPPQDEPLVEYKAENFVHLHSPDLNPKVEEDEPAPVADAFSRFAFGQLMASSNGSSVPDNPKPAATRTASTKGQKIEKDRPTQNGVQMPSAGTLCRAVWDMLTSMMAHDETSLASVPTAQDIKAVGEKMGWNANNVSIEYYRWRKHNGIMGRGKKTV